VLLENMGRRTELATTAKQMKTTAIANPIMIVARFFFLIEWQRPLVCLSLFGDDEPCCSSRGEVESGC